MQHYTLPNYRTTTDVGVYAEAWRSIARPIEEALSLKLGGFDPDFLFHDKDGRSSVTIPKWVAIRLTQALERKNEQQES